MTVISFESNLVAVVSLSSIQIDVVLAALSCLALPKLRLSIKRDRAVTSNLEPIVWVLVLVALEHMGRRSPPTAMALVIKELTSLQSETCRAHTAASSHLA